MLSLFSLFLGTDLRKTHRVPLCLSYRFSGIFNDSKIVADPPMPMPIPIPIPIRIPTRMPMPPPLLSYPRSLQKLFPSHNQLPLPGWPDPGTNSGTPIEQQQDVWNLCLSLVRRSL